MDPLVITSCFCKLVDALLRDGHVLGIAEVFADKSLEGVDGFNMSWCHSQSVAHTESVGLNGATYARTSGSSGEAVVQQVRLRT